ncbi:hypothetical protein KAR91_30370 [Candidatus Pacearchaeota archaeon]|nr:hypothetical protein [Candidatus Pacearchaeota archaeon]
MLDIDNLTKTQTVVTVILMLFFVFCGFGVMEIMRLRPAIMMTNCRGGSKHFFGEWKKTKVFGFYVPMGKTKTCVICGANRGR